MRWLLSPSLAPILIVLLLYHLERNNMISTKWIKMIARKRRGKAEVYISIKTVILIMITILILIMITITTITTALKILT